MAKKASDNLKYYHNQGGPTIATVSRKVIEKDGLVFKDIDGTGEVTPVNDWRLSPAERAAAYVKTLTTDEKIAQLFISDWRMGPKYSNSDTHTCIPDESGVLDDATFTGKTIFGAQELPGTTTLIKDWFSRHLILRANPTPEDMADWLNQLHAVAEECKHFVPVQVASNSRNENGEVVFGMNDASGVFATWPGTMGIAAAVKGDSLDIIDKFADCIRREWNACGLKKGYMYMADCATDPRWQRTFGTFGEDPELITKIFERLIPGVQGSEEGVVPEGVSLTVKHFPGGGARENGFDPHYAAGQWNVYATEGSLQKYHVPTFRPAVKYNAASIMPYYSKPAAEKSATQTDCEGNPLVMNPYGIAYNKEFVDTMLRKQMGFKGYINSDTGIVHNMSWGVEALDIPERIGFAVTQSGVDVISGLFDNKEGREAYDRATNGYYDTHPVPAGFKKEDLVLTDESLNRAVTRTLTELFQQGMFENPYADPKKAAEVVATKSDWAEAALVHRKSVVLLKNQGVLPLTEDKLAGKKVYAEAFAKEAEAAEAATKALREMLTGVTLTEDPAQADYAILMVSPSSGEYFNATPGYLELDICEDKTVCNVDKSGKPMAETHQETTLAGANRIPGIAAAVHANGGKVIANINFPLAWMVGNVEKYADALTAGFDTYPSATLDVIFGRFAPTGKLPITLPRGDEVLAVNAEGVCASPNDVPGYDKDLYMPDSLKDENGKAYAYRDAAGNYYELNFGLSY
ncbi:glycoside hydrolase family 3 N-terminal domain-containing protein [Faecalibacterium gallinarum]|uniref:beta-glucosidase n=1 Tax=Faecalibacterium gallinarum TaxID=2903556 RepID=A0AA37IUJ5_9FIRM|nr:glycoside hydrolase family 3 N-terminal domain-containing protein [Faecalibacterium gallinarum]GJN63378.1 beta-glucosidase [Faecalibacterium gallinarum]